MPDLDAAWLSRVQFAFTIGFHILFPTLTIGLGGFLVLLGGLWLKTPEIAPTRRFTFRHAGYHLRVGSLTPDGRDGRPGSAGRGRAVRPAGRAREDGAT